MDLLQIIGLAATALVSIFGAKAVNTKKIKDVASAVEKKSAGILEVLSDVNALVIAVTEALKPDADGTIRVDAAEVADIKEKLKEVSGVIKSFGKN